MQHFLFLLKFRYYRSDFLSQKIFHLSPSSLEKKIYSQHIPKFWNFFRSIVMKFSNIFTVICPQIMEFFSVVCPKFLNFGGHLSPNFFIFRQAFCHFFSKPCGRAIFEGEGAQRPNPQSERVRKTIFFYL